MKRLLAWRPGIRSWGRNEASCPRRLKDSLSLEWTIQYLIGSEPQSLLWRYTTRLSRGSARGQGDHLGSPTEWVAVRGGAAVVRVFITGSSDGLGLMAARLLIDKGHKVVLHGRDEDRSRDALATAPGARGVVSGDLSTIAGARTVADEVNKLGPFDAVIHNAGIGYREGRVEIEPGVPSVFAVNVLAPYILTALIKRPDRLVYVGSGTHHGVRPRMDDLLWTRRSWSGFSAYAETKLCDV